MPGLRSATTTVRDGYVKLTNPDAIPSTKVVTTSTRIGSAEKAVVFGSIDVIEPLTVEGELVVLVGTPLTEQTLTLLNSDVLEDTTLFGPVDVLAPGADSVTLIGDLTIL